MNLERLETERRNPDTQNLDMLSAYDLVSVIQREDAKVAAAVRQALPAIAAAVDVIVESLRSGGRLFYIGAAPAAGWEFLTPRNARRPSTLPPIWYRR
jgi:N-acetylmuramic acid 6-phosphate etherase